MKFREIEVWLMNVSELTLLDRRLVTRAKAVPNSDNGADKMVS